MKQFKKLSALLMALVLVVALAVPVMADETPTTTTPTTYELTIHGEASGHTYEAYQIFSGTLSGSTLSDVVWGEGVQSDQNAAILEALREDDTFITKEKN